MWEIAALQNLNRPMSAEGSTSAIRRRLIDVRIAPENGPQRLITACRMSTTTVMDRFL